jgi:lycopene cyclase domain-containing protein
VVYWQFLLIFGLAPGAVLALLARRRFWRFKGTFLWIAICIVWLSVSWEAVFVNRVWFYSPDVILGPRILGIPIEEYAFFVLDGLLITALAVLLRRGKANAPD